METNTVVLFTICGMALVALTAFTVYWWRQRERVQGVHTWVAEYLRKRFGGPLDRLSINCSNDTLWPVLVGFDDPRTGLRHRLRFSCPGSPATLALLSEEQAKF